MTEVEAETVRLFLAGAGVVLTAVNSDIVGQQWNEPSVLEEQTVGAVAGHLARGAVWAVGEYLDGAEPEGPEDFDSAGHYFATLMASATEELHRGIRQRGAALAAEGQPAVVSRLTQGLSVLRETLPVLSPGRRVAVIGGRVMRLGDYLETRIVEQVVHLDDLARCTGAEGWALPDGAYRVAVDVAMEVGRRRHGPVPLIRALYRRGFAGEVLPVL